LVEIGEFKDEELFAKERELSNNFIFGGGNGLSQGQNIQIGVAESDGGDIIVILGRLGQEEKLSFILNIQVEFFSSFRVTNHDEIDIFESGFTKGSVSLEISEFRLEVIVIFGAFGNVGQDQN